MRWLSMLIAIAITLPAWGRGDVDFKFGRREAWVGQSFPIQVEVINAADHSPPKIPPIDGATAEVLDAANTSTFTQIINGRRTTRSTVTYTVLIRPERAGLIEIPPIEVVADGETFRSDPWRIVATRSDVGDIMFLDIVASPETAWVGEPVTLTLQIWIKQYRDASQGIALEEESMWSLVDQSDSSWGVFGESLQQMTRERRRPRGREVERNGASYFLYEIPVVRHPIDAGRIDPGDVRVVFQQPLGLTARRDFFGRREYVIDGSRPVIVEATMAPVDVRALPTEGRPAEFTGAVGRFRVEAYAEPREVSVGDPITLVLEVTDIGSGSPVDLANLRPPRLQNDQALAGFRLPDSPTTGVVEGRTKVFTETLRPERDDLTEIPGIAFASFDPTLDRYVVVRTSPIPIRVSPSERIDLGEAVRGGAAPLALAGPTGTSLTAAGGTLRANRPIDVAVLGTTPIRTTAPLALAATAPLAFLVAAAVRRRRAHRDANPHLVRASAARGRAARRLEEDGPVADRVLDAVCGLVAARMHRTDGALTARETIELAERTGLDADRLASLRETLNAAEAARYAPGSSEDDRVLIERARELLPALDRLRPAGGRR
jgi:hypothetical protein